MAPLGKPVKGPNGAGTHTSSALYAPLPLAQTMGMVNGVLVAIMEFHRCQ